MNHNSVYLNITSQYSISSLRIQNPYIVAWWSAAFPGFGHLLIGKLYLGYFLIVWEVIVNSLAHLNEGIYYSMVGEFEQAVHVLNVQYLVLYSPIYIYIIWDSYRCTQEINHLTRAVFQEKKSSIHQQNMDIIDHNVNLKRNPIQSIIWSMLFPSLGYMYNNKFLSFIFGLLLWVTLSTLSHVYDGLYYSYIGDFQLAIDTVKPKWLLFLPSIYVFFAYHAFVDSVEHNRLSEFMNKIKLAKKFNPKSFKMPF
ncbi:hypothetical protein WAK64_02450 [Bacillus spongiae]|uniref:Uncharacterized protein n=1 Tax=Bacillus spongiae TaxID=2683610 RepID=A0ABU8H9F0_9BACI